MSHISTNNKEAHNRFGNSKAVQVRILSKSSRSIGSQRSHDLRLGVQPRHINHSQSSKNRVLITPATGPMLRKICVERRQLRSTSRRIKSNACVGISGIITFGHQAKRLFEKLSNDQQDEAFREVALAIANRLNTSLSGLVIHVDESAPHAHFQLPAYDSAGFPISSQIKRADCRELQTLTADIMARHLPGVERGHPKHERIFAGAKPHEVINRSVAQLHETLPAEVHEKLEYIASIEEKIIKNERLLNKALQKVRSRNDLAQKYAKRIETYRQRADTARKKKLLEEERLKALQLEATRQEEIIALNESKVRREVEDLSKKLEVELLRDGQKALLSLKRERDYWRAAFETLRTVVLGVVPETLHTFMRKTFHEAWDKHTRKLERDASLTKSSETVNQMKI